MVTLDDLKQEATERALGHMLLELDPWLAGKDKATAAEWLRPFVEMTFDAGAKAGRDAQRANGA